MAWVLTAMLDAAGSTPGHEHSRYARPDAGSAWLSAGARAAPMWASMSVAMMVAPALPAVRHVGLNSLRWRRQRAVAEFLFAYVSVWLMFGMVALPLVALIETRTPEGTVLAAALTAASAWQLLPYRGRFRRACHRTVPLPPSGWRAAAGAIRFGLRYGKGCLGLCWPLMLVMAVMIHSGVLLMAPLGAIAAGLRLLPRDVHVARVAAIALGASAVCLPLFGHAGAARAERRVSGHAHHTHLAVSPARGTGAASRHASASADPSRSVAVQLICRLPGAHY